MTEAEAERRYKHQLLRRRQAVDSAKSELAAAERRLEEYEKNRVDYIEYFRLLP